MIRLVAALALVAAGTACSADDTPSQTGTSAASTGPTGPVALEIADVHEQSGEPDFLLDAFGSVWTVTASGYTRRLDPGAGEVLDEYDNGYHSQPACNGDGFDGTALWVCSGPEHLARLDPETGAATRVAASKRADQTRFPFAAGLIWFLESGTNALVGLDAGGAVGAQVPLGMVCTNTAFDESTIYVMCPTDGKVLQVDAASAAVTATIDVLNPRQAAVAGYLFVGSGDDLVQLDLDSLEVVHTYDGLGPATYGDIDATTGEVWVRQEDGVFLTRIDPESHEVVATVEAPDYPSGGDVLITDEWIWATAFDQGVVVRVAR